MFIFFFFKQKTAYEMRISDWSSDVCSSDLPAEGRQVLAFRHGRGLHGGAREDHGLAHLGQRQLAVQRRCGRRIGRHAGNDLESDVERAQAADLLGDGAVERRVAGMRSEEHTSELQSLMRISYAVFCLKKKNQRRTTRETV